MFAIDSAGMLSGRVGCIYSADGTREQAWNCLAKKDTLPPGLAKKLDDNTPPGQAKKDGDWVPPGLAKKGEDWLPPGLAKQGKIPPGHAKRLGVEPTTSG